MAIGSRAIGATRTRANRVLRRRERRSVRRDAARRQARATRVRAGALVSAERDVQATGAEDDGQRNEQGGRVPLPADSPLDQPAPELAQASPAIDYGGDDERGE